MLSLALALAYIRIATLKADMIKVIQLLINKDKEEKLQNMLQIIINQNPKL